MWAKAQVPADTHLENSRSKNIRFFAFIFFSYIQTKTLMSKPSFKTHIPNHATAHRLLAYLSNQGNLVKDSCWQEDLAKAAKPRSEINNRVNKSRTINSSCRCCKSVPSEKNNSYCAACKKNLNSELYFLKKAYSPQKGDVCSLCKKRCKKICLDHCHSTGEARGWICLRCNASCSLVSNDFNGFEVYCRLKFSFEISSYEFPERNRKST